MSSSGPVQTPPTSSPRAQRSAQVIFCTTVLALEAFVVLFATLVGIGLDLADAAIVWSVGGAGVLVCLVLAGLAKRRIGVILGSVVQGLLIAAGFLIPMMFTIGIIFAIIWVVALRLGHRIDVERAERAEAGPDRAAPGPAVQRSAEV